MEEENIQDLRSEINHMIQDVGLNDPELKVKYVKLFKTYPKMYQMISEKKDLTIIFGFLDRIEKIKKGNLDLEKETENVKESLFKKFMEPKLKKIEEL